ncbi:MAG: hypothetical protein LBT54_01940 [Bifidobacteriaceae bacterium]|nr:hypothetical protein [Bifidobacteriaceae bacterium]
MRLTGAAGRRAGAALLAGAVAAGTAASCAREPEPDPEQAARAAYCDTMHSSVVEIDQDKLIAGDKATVEAAATLYQNLGELAPEQLSDEWDIIVRDMEQMIRQANGLTPSTTVNSQTFRAAYATIYDDYLVECVGPSEGTAR